MIHCKELNQDFETKEELFGALKTHKDNIIAAKKAQIYKSYEKGVSITAKPLDSLKLGTETKELKLDDNYYYIAVNSTRILDSHLDLHLNGIWSKTVKEQQGKNYLVADHKLEIDKTIVRKEYVEMLTAVIPFSMIGKNYEGDTEVLIYKVRKDKITNKIAREWLESGDSIEASVRMQYMDIVFAFNSDAKGDEKEKKAFDELYPLIANKEDFEHEIYYFWGVKQAKNVMESSLVLFGSNNATGQITIETKDQPPKGTGEEPSDDTRVYKYLIKQLQTLKKS